MSLLLSKQCRVVQLGGDLVGAHHQDEGHNGLEQTDSGAVGVHALGKTIAIGIGIQNVGVVQDGIVAHEELLFKAGGKDAADRQDQQDGDRRADRGQRDVPDALDTAGTVDGGCFIELFVNAGDGGEINDGVVTHALPGVGDGDDPPEVGAVLEEQNPFMREAQTDQQVIDDAETNGTSAKISYWEYYQKNQNVASKELQINGEWITVYEIEFLIGEDYQYMRIVSDERELTFKCPKVLSDELNLKVKIAQN